MCELTQQDGRYYNVCLSTGMFFPQSNICIPGLQKGDRVIVQLDLDSAEPTVTWYPYSSVEPSGTKICGSITLSSGEKWWPMFALYNVGDDISLRSIVPKCEWPKV